MLWGDKVLWTQSLPSENGRISLMECDEKGEPKSVLPAPWNIRSKAHEYGGGAYVLDHDTFYFVNASDQNIYAYTLGKGLNSVDPVAITQNKKGDVARYADLKIANNKVGGDTWLYAIAEHLGTASADGAHHNEPKVSVIAINTRTQQLYTLAEGADFYAGLTINPQVNYGQHASDDRHQLAFIAWQHPNMPWDETALWQLEWAAGNPASIQQTCIHSPSGASIVQPEFSPQGTLFYVSDEHNGWWNICQAKASGAHFKNELVCSLEADCATPQWTFGMKNWGFLDAQTILCSYSQNGAWSLAKLNLAKKQAERPLTHHDVTRIETPYQTFSDMYCHNSRAVFLAAGFHLAPTPAYYLESDDGQAIIEPVVNQTPADYLEANSAAEHSNISEPKSRYFESNDGNRVHFWLYMPRNSQFKAPSDSKPPLIVLGHGGPTGATDPAFNLKIQFWTQRGFAVADVNYRGSTGFGREYRQALQKSWGIKDVEDLCQVANHLVSLDEVHPQAKFIKGSSAGGYSVLAALTLHDVFDGGVSLYGIANLHSLATDTHKFESHYLDGLIGPYPEEQQEYTDRSPINHIDKLSCPIFIAQGLDDKVVPPSQAELIVNAAKTKGIPVTYLPFEGEGHGFRLPTTLKTLFEQELLFYQSLLQKKPA